MMNQAVTITGIQLVAHATLLTIMFYGCIDAVSRVADEYFMRIEVRPLTVILGVFALIVIGGALLYVSAVLYTVITGETVMSTLKLLFSHPVVSFL